MARSKRRSIHAPNLTDELRAAAAAFESVWFGRFGLERPTKLNSAGLGLGLGFTRRSCHVPNPTHKL